MQTSETPTAGDRQRDEFVARMEKRVNDLDARLMQLRQSQAQTSGRKAVSEDRLEAIQENIKDLREEIADLRTANRDNWWPATERSVERTHKSAQTGIDKAATDTQTRARTETGQTAATSDSSQSAAPWEQRRDRFVSKMTSELQKLEQDLQTLQSKRRGVSSDDVQDIQTQITELRTQITGLREINPDNWWDRTQQRLNRSVDGLERSIQNLGSEREKNQ